MPSTALPPPNPEFFIDRSLGSKKLKNALQQLGYTVHTMNERYGVRPGEQKNDPNWIEDAGDNSFLILTKDDVRKPEPQIRDIENAKAKVFYLTEARLKSPKQIEWYLVNLDRILRAGKKPGPCMYGVYKDRIERLPLRPPSRRPPPEQTSILNGVEAK